MLPLFPHSLKNIPNLVTESDPCLPAYSENDQTEQLPTSRTDPIIKISSEISLNEKRTEERSPDEGDVNLTPQAPLLDLLTDDGRRTLREYCDKQKKLEADKKASLKEIKPYRGPGLRRTVMELRQDAALDPAYIEALRRESKSKYPNLGHWWHVRIKYFLLGVGVDKHERVIKRERMDRQIKRKKDEEAKIREKYALISRELRNEYSQLLDVKLLDRSTK